jgi:hypothetical protein
VLKEIDFGPNVAYIPRNFKLEILLWPLIILLICGISTSTYCLYLMDREIRKMKAILTAATHRLQRMLFISTLSEHVVCSLVLSFPLVVLTFAIAFPIPYGSRVGYVMFTTMSLQTLMSAVFQCYFIKPFRKAIQDLILKLLRKSTVQEIFVVPSSQMISRSAHVNPIN